MNGFLNYSKCYFSKEITKLKSPPIENSLSDLLEVVLQHQSWREPLFIIEIRSIG